METCVIGWERTSLHPNPNRFARQSSLTLFDILYEHRHVWPTSPLDRLGPIIMKRRHSPSLASTVGPSNCHLELHNLASFLRWASPL